MSGSGESVVGGGLTVGQLIAHLASTEDFDAVVQFTVDEQQFFVAAEVNQWHDGGIVVGIFDGWADA